MSEELKEMGIEIYDLSDEEQEFKKVVVGVEFHMDGSWNVISMDLEGGAGISDLDGGYKLVKILPILKDVRDTFLKALKEVE